MTRGQEATAIAGANAAVLLSPQNPASPATGIYAELCAPQSLIKHKSIEERAQAQRFGCVCTAAWYAHAASLPENTDYLA